MLLKYSFLFLTLSLIYFSITYSMITIDHLPQEYQKFLRTISTKDNASAELILRDNPTIDINIIASGESIPYILAACYDQDNDYMLKYLIDKGLDTAKFGYFLYWITVEKKYFSPAVFKMLVEYGALKQLTPEQHFTLLTRLLFLPCVDKQKAIQCVLDNGLDIAHVKRHRTELFTAVANYSKHCEFNAYCAYALHSNTNFYSIPDKQTTKEYINNERIQVFAGNRALLDALKEKGVSFTLKTQDFKQLLGFLANEGNTNLAQYFIAHNDVLSAQDLETIITNARIYSDDPIISDFIVPFVNTYLKQLSPIIPLDQQEVVKLDTTKYLIQQWLIHKNKDVVKLLRRFTLIQRFFKSLTTPEIAHKIAQYAIADFQDQKLDYFPSYDNVLKFIVRKALECLHRVS